jgi:hypothetical protein
VKVIKLYTKSQAAEITGGLTQTSKMPCKSYSLPTIACRTGFEMAKIPGSVCSGCYANKGFYSMYAKTIEPAQHARLVAIEDPDWISGMVSAIGQDQFFRWHDSGDIQSLEHLEKIVDVCNATPDCRHWLPTREYGIVKEFIAKHGAIPENLVIRLSAMFPDKPVIIPASLQGIKGITASNVHTTKPIGTPCAAPSQKGECRECRECWNRSSVVSYQFH